MPEQQYDLINQFLRGAINRRTFIRKAVGLGLAAPVVASTLAMVPRGAFAQDAALPAPSAPREEGTPAPDDQQMPYPQGGEEVELISLTPSGRTFFRSSVGNRPTARVQM